MKGKILCLDYGKKRVGIAASDPLWITAQKVGLVEKETEQSTEAFWESLLQFLKNYSESWEVDHIVLGLPRHMDGSLSPMAEEVRRLGTWLEQKLDVKIVFWDERLSTRQAERELIRCGMSRKKRKKVVDTTAAQLILQSYLNSLGKTG